MVNEIKITKWRGKGQKLFARIIFKCDFCKKKSNMIPALYKRRKYHFCSYKCKNRFHSIMMTGRKGISYYGENNPNWKGGIAKNSYPKKFRHLRETVRQRDNYKCQVCGCPQIECIRKLAIHHIDYDKKNSDFNNLISLCNHCHTKTNSNRDYWTKYFKEKGCTENCRKIRLDINPSHCQK